jgi:hypothetical protein
VTSTCATFFNRLTSVLGSSIPASCRKPLRGSDRTFSLRSPQSTNRTEPKFRARLTYEATEIELAVV